MSRGCLISWSCTRLQSKITLSTVDAEYVAMSISTKELIPLHHIVKTIIETVGLDPELNLL